MVREKLRPQKRSRINKAYNIHSICAETRRRLAEIQLEDLNEVFRFWTGTLLRLYGFRIAEVAFILWSGSDHKNLT
jgi:hypothetical protein